MSEDLQTYELAEVDYINGMKYKEIAEKYGVSINTVKSWKTRYKWCKQKGVHTKTKKVCTQNKKENASESREALSEVESVIENTNLNDKQRLFCLYMVKYFNATKAYQKAYGCSYGSAMTRGCESLRNVKIQEEIRKLKQAKLNREFLSGADIFQKYMDIAFSDITDYLSFGKKSITYIDKQGAEQEAEINYVDLNNSNEVDGTLITEVKQGKDGISIKLADKMKALEWLANHMDLATEEQRLRMEKLKKDIGENNKEPIKIEFVKASQRGE